MSDTPAPNNNFPPYAQMVELLTGWMPQQRWFAAKGSTPQLRVVGRVDLPECPVPARIYLVEDTAGSAPVLYQVPLVIRPAGSEPAPQDAAVVAQVPAGLLVDLCQDADGARALLHAVLAEVDLRAEETEETPEPMLVDGHRATGAGAVDFIDSVDQISGARLLGGEQSNSSIVFTTHGEGPDLIGKVFRTVQAGLNPDVEIQQVLADEGCRLVPAPLGDVVGTWETQEAEHRKGNLFFVQEFVPGAQDAWRVATVAAAEGRSFAARAHALGAATAEVHSVLGQAMVSSPADDHQRRALLDSWNQRLASAIETVPELAEHEERIREIQAAGADDHWPELQRIHGDYHLGQVLDVPGRGWVLLDFEGEPLRPLSERVQPDLTTRDVAGMLRSFDYAAGSVERQDGAQVSAEKARSWAREARDAFLTGYRQGVPQDADPSHHTALLQALELDKALYEVVYEARNRPDWIDIPLSGVRRILAEA